jgi:WD40 repeat protein
MGLCGCWTWPPVRRAGEPLAGHEGTVEAVAVAVLDGRAIAVSGGADATVRVWDLVAGGALGEPLTGHRGDVKAVAVGALDGRPIAISGGADAIVRVSNLDGTEIGVIDIGSAVLALAVRGGTIVVGAFVGLMAIELTVAARLH